MIRFFLSATEVALKKSPSVSEITILLARQQVGATLRMFGTTAPYINSFKQLKAAEGKKPCERYRSTYKENHTGALALLCSISDLSDAKDDKSKLLSLAKTNVIEHAARRVDLLFYLFVAYYRSELIPIRGHTILQHGTGRSFNKTSLTQACHSSFIPNLLDQTIFQKNGEAKSLLSGTHFLESLNSTVELPGFVNVFDSILENLCRHYCIKLLQKVSDSSLDPIQALTQFLCHMNTLLSNLQAQAQAQNQSKIYFSLPHPMLKERHCQFPRALINCVREGTLKNTFDLQTSKVTDECVELLLRIGPKEKEAYRVGSVNKDQLYQKRIFSIQEEILNSKAVTNSMRLI